MGGQEDDDKGVSLSRAAGPPLRRDCSTRPCRTSRSSTPTGWTPSRRPSSGSSLLQQERAVLMMPEMDFSR